MKVITITLFTSCILSRCYGLEYGMSGGIPHDDWAIGSHVSQAKADAAWKECSDKYMRNGGSGLVEQCMNDKGLIRLSEIRRRQKRAETQRAVIK
ncbi:hypothetical protein [Neisseria meningitidis]|uniref:hypothetical protein n=1 Tax=Neisseria meningitidis TaxID=487 RepID=UPI0009AB9CF4|nr:hypothetical protein [Neisseria meningitidis]